MLDLLVIGAGLSGLMAAHTAASAGLKVRIVNKGLGALHWSAGTIDVFGYERESAADMVPKPLPAIARHIQQHPQHPYGLLEASQMKSRLDAFLKLVEEAGLPYGGHDDGRNLRLPSPVGAVRPTFLAPRAQLRGDLDRPDPLLIVGFTGLRDYYPMLIAENLSRQGFAARAVALPWEVLTDRRDANPVQLATELDDGARRARLGQALRKHVQPGERIGLPAILGLNNHAAVMADLETISGAPVFEIPTLPPSVPGIRLFKALQNSLRALGVRIEVAMEATGAGLQPPQNGTGGQIEWVETATSARPLKHRAAHYLLATGGILGGGFRSDQDGRVWEVIFDLPLAVPQDRSEWFESRFLSEAGHPVFRGGVRVDNNFQPLGGNDRVLYSNLWAAGHTLNGADPILERSVEGVAILTGMAAANALAAR